MTEAYPGFVTASSLMQDTKTTERFSFGEEAVTADGTCLKKETVFPLMPRHGVDEEMVRLRLAEDLTLIAGIGKIREAELKRNGIQTVHDLKRTRFRNAAEDVSDILENGTVKEILSLYAELRRNSEPLLLGLMGDENSHLYFDIETLGMAHSPIILFGIGEIEADSVKVTQYLLRDIEEELPALMLTREHFKKHSAVISYNGRCFDIPYLNNRLAYYGEREVRFGVHIDLLHPTRRLFRHEFPDCRLETVEAYIPTFSRVEDVPGYLVPAYYQNYLRSKNLEILRPVVEHNTLDVANLTCLLNYETELLYG
ncbi:MAG: exonuclease [Methanocorpusculum parvum]|nr:exonuclease [Methanocorpusculum parvum]